MFNTYSGDYGYNIIVSNEGTKRKKLSFEITVIKNLEKTQLKSK